VRVDLAIFVGALLALGQGEVRSSILRGGTTYLIEN